MLLFRKLTEMGFISVQSHNSCFSLSVHQFWICYLPWWDWWWNLGRIWLEKSPELTQLQLWLPSPFSINPVRFWDGFWDQTLVCRIPIEARGGGIRDTLPLPESTSLFLFSSSAKYNRILRVAGESWLSIPVGIGRICSHSCRRKSISSWHLPVCSSRVLQATPGVPGCSGTLHSGWTQEKSAGILLPNFGFLAEITMQGFP